MGDKAALAVGLAARPQGTTMGEIRSHTDQGQYNVFKRLEEVGHTVIRKGKGAQMRIWLRHKAAGEADLKEANEVVDMLPREVVDEVNDAVMLTFSLERDLQVALRANLAQLEDGLVVADHGSEEKFRDITAQDRDGNLVVIELKATKAGKDAVAQLLAYMAEAATMRNVDKGKVRGILVAPAFQEKALSAASMTPAVALKTYRVGFSFTDAS
ncbi:MULTISPECIES: endonuclease NucS domain-containing protein [unclassified Mesorhizobium]|uniref:endonuclease NucS domain-containing protein n=1 Tax=unclassified Mesorhizobium TaxID=325217 RepID=UPI003339A651